MMEDYSGFYYNRDGIYQNLVFYISPMPEQELYMIRKTSLMLNTANVLKSIETGFNGYDYEIYKCKLTTKKMENPDNDDEIIALADFVDFSNKQEFSGMVLASKDMPMYEKFEDYLYEVTKDLPLLVEGRDPKNKLIMPADQQPAQAQPVQQPVQTQPVQQVEQVEEVLEEPAPKNFNEQLMTPQQRAIEDSQTLAFQIVQSNEDLNKEDNNQ